MNKQYENLVSSQKSFHLHLALIVVQSLSSPLLQLPLSLWFDLLLSLNILKANIVQIYCQRKLQALQKIQNSMATMMGYQINTQISFKAIGKLAVNNGIRRNINRDEDRNFKENNLKITDLRSLKKLIKYIHIYKNSFLLLH